MRFKELGLSLLGSIGISLLFRVAHEGVLVVSDIELAIPSIAACFAFIWALILAERVRRLSIEYQHHIESVAPDA